MDVQTIISEVMAREGAPTNDPLDTGGRTKYGISETSNPEAWADGDVTSDEARTLYLKKYVEGPGFSKVSHPGIMAQLVDFGVNSGPGIAIRELQRILKVPDDGVLGPATLKAVQQADPRALNNALVAARVKLLCKICVKTPSQLKFLSGWVNRALEFLL